MADTDKPRTRIKGVFSLEKKVKVGSGATTRRTTQTMYWFAEEMDDDRIFIQPLNPNYVPSGPKQEIAREEFLENYGPEPEFYTTKVFPNMRKLTQTVAKAERFRANGYGYSAELEFNNALKVDEENIRANFGLGLTYLDRGDTDKANDIFRRLISLDAAFEAEHKHLFNDFGISLRKNGMYEQAVQYYSKALALSPNDEHLHYNISRAYFGKADLENAVAHLRKCLSINPNLEIANKFSVYLQKNNLLRASDGSAVTTTAVNPADLEAAVPD